MNNQSFEIPFQIYEPPEVVTAIANTPRFGHQSNFESSFMSGTLEQESYLIGVSIAGFICCGFFVVWGILLLSFMFCGYRRVGFLSGCPFLQETNHGSRSTKKTNKKDEEDIYFDDDDDSINDGLSDVDNNAHSKSYQPASFCYRPTRIRIAYLLCGTVFISFSVLVVTEGLKNLQSLVVVMQSSAQEVNSLSTSAADILENGFLRAGEVAETSRTLLSDELGVSFCPADPSLENNAEALMLREEGTKALAQLDQLGDFMESSVVRVLDPLKQIADGSKKLDSALEPIDLTSWQALLVLIPLSVTPSLLMLGTVMALLGISIPFYTCFSNWIIMPIFSLLVVFSWIVASGMIIAAGINGDFCLPSGYYDGNPPDTTIRNIMNVTGLTNTTAYEVIDFYIAQCRNEDPFTFIYEAQPQLNQSEAYIEQLGAMISSPDMLSVLSLYCNRDYSNLNDLVTSMDTLLALLSDSVARTLQLIRCDRIVPLYTETIYQGGCTYAPAAVAWVFASTLVLGFTGMLMITLRSSYKNTEYYTSDAHRIEDDHVPDSNESYGSDSGEYKVDDRNGVE